MTPPASATLPAGAARPRSRSRPAIDNMVKQEPTIVLSITSGSGLHGRVTELGPDHDHQQQRARRHISGGTTVSPGGSATLTVTADQAPLHDTQVHLRSRGRRPRHRLPPGQPGRDARRRHDVGERHGQHAHQQRDPARPAHRRVNAPSPTSYSVGSPGSAVITTRWEQLPPVSRCLGDHVPAEGPALRRHRQPEPGRQLAADDRAHLRRQRRRQAPTTPSRREHRRARRPDGRPGADPDRHDNVVEADRVLTVSLAPRSGYQIGSPNSASVTITSPVLPTLTITGNTRRWRRAARPPSRSPPTRRR